MHVAWACSLNLFCRLQRTACDCVANARDEGTLLTAAHGLSNVSAMELRAVLLAATQAQRARRMQSTLDDLRQSTSAMRTMGKLLTPRLQARSVERDIAGVMLTQGAAVAELAQELESALEPVTSEASVRGHAHPASPQPPQATLVRWCDGTVCTCTVVRGWLR